MILIGTHSHKFLFLARRTLSFSVDQRLCWLLFQLAGMLQLAGSRVLDWIAFYPVLFGQRDMQGIIPRITKMAA